MIEQLKGMIQDGQTDQAIELVQGAENYHECEEFVHTVLREEKSAPELVEAVLVAFLNTRPDYAGRRNYGGGHGGWVHSLSHFSDTLWKRRMDGWIKKFNEVSFMGANELHDSSCSDRHVDDFGKYAKFDDDTVDFALTTENLRWMDWGEEWLAYSKARIEAGRFESEEAFLRWKLATPEAYMHQSWDFIGVVVSPEKIRTAIQRLRELGVDTGEYQEFERQLLGQQLGELEGKRPSMDSDWERDRLGENIKTIADALNGLTN